VSEHELLDAASAVVAEAGNVESQMSGALR